MHEEDLRTSPRQLSNGRQSQPEYWGKNRSKVTNENRLNLISLSNKSSNHRHWLYATKKSSWISHSGFISLSVFFDLRNNNNVKDSKKKNDHVFEFVYSTCTVLYEMPLNSRPQRRSTTTLIFWMQNEEIELKKNLLVWRINKYSLFHLIVYF
jgi:hypothetical protein